MRGNNLIRGRRGVAGVLVALILAAGGALVNWFSPLIDQYAPLDGGQSSAPANGSARLENGIPQGSYTLTGMIVNVADGDTVTLRTPDGQRRIRMDSIDAPEERHGSDQPGQPYAEASRKNLADLVAGKTLTAQCYEKDQYGRDVCALMLPDGNSANRAQVQAGYAWAYTARRGEYLHDKRMPALQQQAKNAGLGLWVQADAIQPWKWRYDCWKQRNC